MTTETAARLRELHTRTNPLILPNAWDAASARAVEAAGFPVVATGSAAMAAVLGYEDGEHTPPGEMLAAVARIARAVSVPVTADMERGYGLPPAELVERLLETGAVGCNLEDSGHGGLVDMEEQADFLAAVRAAAGGDLVVNARVDTYVAGDRTTSDALARGGRYLKAGADCVYPIGLTDPEEIGTLAAQLPINVLFRPGAPSLAELAALGVVRVSYGHGLHQAAHAYAEGLFAAVREGHDPYRRDA
ncbi:isocitrate lyase/PEP mutase family protein [Nonomuraea africana]|uniref:2-methylisocitrate lyase-like PEP mutase family enzyme n=1 Tax=Nonomuraea africana TaxID=46171 RepID=A0ABR9KK67_9ACTN|nr:isocitrate lyase/phosphoenolpyruvate mutase family protein [Nonomuraea africana]MBE1562417.1 2-methylisocitrate lyase-like PEP mutase family enzyme [Nonomuraea africana]